MPTSFRRKCVALRLSTPTCNRAGDPLHAEFCLVFLEISVFKRLLLREHRSVTSPKCLSWVAILDVATLFFYWAHVGYIMLLYIGQFGYPPFQDLVPFTAGVFPPIGSRTLQVYVWEQAKVGSRITRSGVMQKANKSGSINYQGSMLLPENPCFCSYFGAVRKENDP